MQDGDASGQRTGIGMDQGAGWGYIRMYQGTGLELGCIGVLDGVALGCIGAKDWDWGASECTGTQDWGASECRMGVHWGKGLELGCIRVQDGDTLGCIGPQNWDGYGWGCRTGVHHFPGFISASAAVFAGPSSPWPAALQKGSFLRWKAERRFCGPLNIVLPTAETAAWCL